MADYAELLMAKSNEELALLTRDSGGKLRVKADKQLTARLHKLDKSFHDCAHTLDSGYKSEFITELNIEGFDDEQVFQQKELQNDAAVRQLLENFSTTSIEEAPLCFISSNDRNWERGKKGKTKKRVEAEDVTVRRDKIDDDIDSDDTGGASDVGSEQGSEESEESDAELARIKERIKTRDSGEFGLFSNDTFDSEDETLFKGAEEDDQDEDENDFDFEINIPTKTSASAKQKQQISKASNKRKTEVDDKFFKLADMEEFLEREDRREERKQRQNGNKENSKDEDSSGESEEDTEDIDMFAEWSDEDAEKGAMYADFFDPPPDGEEVPLKSSKKTKPTACEEEEEVDEDEDNIDDEVNMDDDEEGTGESKKKVRFSENTKDPSDDKKEESLISNFQKRNERLLRQIQSYEEELLQPKPWQMSGEVGASARSENSLLEDHLQFDQTTPAASEITEEVTQTIEELILQRIKDKAFDDNQRQVRPREEAYELKTQKTLDQEKSKLSLHEVYEQEYLKLQAPEQEETNPLHDEVKKMMSFLFPRLDALASWHYKPTQAVPEVKIRSNLPAIQMEEATPITMSNSGVLAPEEVKAKKKGEVKGKTERSQEDKRRERKQKKAAKREKMREKEKHLKEVEKLNPGLGNKYSKERALKELEKQAKGNLEVIKEKKKSRKSMSSKAFFTQLQEEVTTQIRAKTKKEKEKKKQISSEKFLL